MQPPQDPRPASAVAPELTAFLSLGFRPLYLAGAAWAAASIAIWIFAPHWLQPPLAGVAWHAHEMLWGFIATVAVGFLLTAGATWTGRNPLQGAALAFACVLWLIARAGFLVGGDAAFVVATVAEIGFFVVAAAAMARVVILARSRRNYGVPLLLLALGASDAAFLHAAFGGDPTSMRYFHAGLLVMAVLALLIARRVIPFFAMRAVQGLQISMHARSGQVQLAVGILAVVALLLQVSWLMAASLGVVGALAIVQTLAWRPLAVRHEPLLWILYAGYAGLGLGLLAAAVQAGGGGLRSAVHVHVIAMAGFSVLIIGMITRTALGHLGRKLALDRGMLFSFALVLAAVALRLVALWPSAASAPALHASALAWVAAFGLYLWRFIPWLVRPRADAAPRHVSVRPG